MHKVMTVYQRFTGLENWTQISRGEGEDPEGPQTNQEEGTEKIHTLVWIPFKTYLSRDCLEI